MSGNLGTISVCPRCDKDHLATLLFSDGTALENVARTHITPYGLLAVVYTCCYCCEVKRPQQTVTANRCIVTQSSSGLIDSAGRELRRSEAAIMYKLWCA